jgi:hypothetical protein
LYLIALAVGVHVERRNMAGESLLQMLEDLASKIKLLEYERREAVAKIKALEREVGDQATLIAQASAKVDEILKEGTTADISQPRAVNAPATSTAPEPLGEFSADPQRAAKWRSSKAFRFD